MSEGKNIQKPTKKAWGIAFVIGSLSIWFKVVIKGQKEIEGYKFREVGNLPIVGVNHFEGYEILNPQTNKVLYRKVKHWGIIGNRLGDYDPKRYNVISNFFPQNAL